jgi:50S ribosomal protein L16 3-hydroxylase
MLDSFTACISEGLASDLTWRDPPLEVQDQPNEITPASVEAARAVLGEYLKTDTQALPAWFGRFISDTKADMAMENEDRFDDLAVLIAAHVTLFRNPASRFAFWRDDKDALLFVDGDDYRVSLAFAESLCTQREVNAQILSGSITACEASLVLDLYNSGKLIPQP